MDGSLVVSEVIFLSAVALALAISVLGRAAERGRTGTDAIAPDEADRYNVLRGM